VQTACERKTAARFTLQPSRRHVPGDAGGDASNGMVTDLKDSSGDERWPMRQ
jgi:hypothetical protein